MTEEATSWSPACPHCQQPRSPAERTCPHCGAPTVPDDEIAAQQFAHLQAGRIDRDEYDRSLQLAALPANDRPAAAAAAAARRRQLRQVRAASAALVLLVLLALSLTAWLVQPVA